MAKKFKVVKIKTSMKKTLYKITDSSGKIKEVNNILFYKNKRLANTNLKKLK